MKHGLSKGVLVGLVLAAAMLPLGCSAAPRGEQDDEASSQADSAIGASDVLGILSDIERAQVKLTLAQGSADFSGDFQGFPFTTTVEWPAQTTVSLKLDRSGTGGGQFRYYLFEADPYAQVNLPYVDNLGGRPKIYHVYWRCDQDYLDFRLDSEKNGGNQSSDLEHQLIRAGLGWLTQQWLPPKLQSCDVLGFAKQSLASSSNGFPAFDALYTQLAPSTSRAEFSTTVALKSWSKSFKLNSHGATVEVPAGKLETKIAFYNPDSPVLDELMIHLPQGLHAGLSNGKVIADGVSIERFEFGHDGSSTDVSVSARFIKGGVIDSTLHTLGLVVTRSANGKIVVDVPGSIAASSDAPVKHALQTPGVVAGLNAGIQLGAAYNGLPQGRTVADVLGL